MEMLLRLTLQTFTVDNSREVIIYSHYLGH